MGFRFRKSFRPFKGVRINVGKRGLSGVSAGGRLGGIGLGRRGVRMRASLPGTGVGYEKGCALPLLAAVALAGSVAGILAAQV